MTENTLYNIQKSWSVTTGGLTADDSTTPTRTPVVSCSCAKTNMDGNKQLALFIETFFY